MNPVFDPQHHAQALAQAWSGAQRVPAARLPIDNDAQAYAVQDALATRLGPVAGWKVGASSDSAEPNAAPLPASVVVPAAGATLHLPARSLRLIELEVAVRLRTDLLPGERMLSRDEVMEAVEAVLPVIEVVDSRLAETREAPAALRLADLQSHGALAYGAPSGVPLREVDMGRLRTRLWFDGELAADVTGAHAAPDIWRLVAWLARHAQARGRPLRAGDVVTTGSCTPPVIAAEGARVTGEITGLGRLEITL
jgi:2-keto-4-pentenoate hydratase